MNKRIAPGFIFALIAALSVSTVFLVTEAAAAEATKAVSEEAESEDTESEKEYTADEILSCLEYNIEDCVTLNDYMNMEVHLDTTTEVSDEDVEEMVEAFASMYPNVYVESDKDTVEEGDSVNIDYTGYLDGETFDGGSATDYDLVIGSDSFIDGFEDSLIGAKKGETTKINVTFPEDYGVDSLNGQEVEFEVTIHSISEPQAITYEDVSDQWVADNFTSQGITTMEELREYLRDYLESMNESDYDDQLQDAILNQMVEESEITIPEGYLEKRIELYKESVYNKVEESGQSFEECMGGTEEEFLETLPANMETRIKKDMILQALVKDRDITVKQSNFNSYIQNYLSYYGYTEPEQLYEQLDALSELDGESYALLSYAEHQAWYQIQSKINVVTE